MAPLGVRHLNAAIILLYNSSLVFLNLVLLPAIRHNARRDFLCVDFTIAPLVIQINSSRWFCQPRYIIHTLIFDWRLKCIFLSPRVVSISVRFLRAPRGIRKFTLHRQLMAVRRIFLADGKRALLKKCDNYRFLHGAGPRFLLATFTNRTGECKKLVKCEWIHNVMFLSIKCTVVGNDLRTEPLNYIQDVCNSLRHDK